jgi:hypothetical protein
VKPFDLVDPDIKYSSPAETVTIALTTTDMFSHTGLIPSFGTHFHRFSSGGSPLL